jgi:acyl-CoA synthetase (AMP-forming)/AMP-acid ligase II
MVLNNTFMMLNTVIDDLKQYQCTGFAGVPSHFQILLRKSGWFRQMNFPRLKYVTQAGGKLPKAFIKEFVETFPEVKFYVMYGQTEATARLSYLPPELVLTKLGSIGKGIPGVKLEVLDKNGAPVRRGEVGELAATGKNIMFGYFHDEELTASTIRDGKLYTGDLGTVDEDGFIYIVAREKEFLKVGGERVSPKEIEEVIVRLPEVVDCSILGVPDDMLGEAIKALVVLNNGRSLTEDDIIAHCTRHLSSTRIPKYVEFLDKIPVSDTGKKVKAQLIKLNQ